ncbi:hypothetical protein RhiirA4_467509 [Rhizophagus irregularis]|uniref:Uncharacterized protein n=1 Tax=Rhizophagus irregularis TaxID=588596 RepID=A0A2I1GW41_9GLOM|nr:hypothetical protein RhiirA4_467509 [Rhizophagus irregularis]
MEYINVFPPDLNVEKEDFIEEFLPEFESEEYINRWRVIHVNILKIISSSIEARKLILVPFESSRCDDSNEPLIVFLRLLDGDILREYSKYI